MIAAINTINTFKGVYILNENKMSKSQKQIALNIQSSLKDYGSKEDYIIYKDKDDKTVLLSQVFNLRASKKNLNPGEYTYLKRIDIGKYNEDKQFDVMSIENFKDIKQQRKDNIFNVVGLLLLTSYLTLGIAHYVKKVLPLISKAENNIELVNNQNLKKNLVEKLK